MIRSLTVTNYLNESIFIDLFRPQDTGLLIKEITGLGPAKGTINITEVSTNDGGLYNSARVSSRNIVITFGFLFVPTIEDVRQKTYKFFPIKKPVTLLIETDNRKVMTVGYVESNEPEIFSKEETAKISLICPDPYLYSQEVLDTMFNGMDPLFEFPFSNELYFEDQACCMLPDTEPYDTEDGSMPKRIEFGMVKNRTFENIFYRGDAEIGFHIIMNAIGYVKTIKIINQRTAEQMIIDTEKLEAITGYGFIRGDKIDICTERGNKYAYLYRGDDVYNIINCIDKDSDWFMLAKGDNLFTYVAEDGISNLQFRIESRTAYEGV